MHVRTRTKYIVRPEEKSRRGRGGGESVAFCMHACNNASSDASLHVRGREKVASVGRDEERGGRFGFPPLSSRKIFGGGKSNKMRGIAVPEEEEGLSSTTVSPIEIGNEPPSRKRDLGSVSDAAAQLLLDKVGGYGVEM